MEVLLRNGCYVVSIDSPRGELTKLERGVL